MFFGQKIIIHYDKEYTNPGLGLITPLDNEGARPSEGGLLHNRWYL